MYVGNLNLDRQAKQQHFCQPRTKQQNAGNEIF